MVLMLEVDTLLWKRTTCFSVSSQQSMALCHLRTSYPVGDYLCMAHQLRQSEVTHFLERSQDLTGITPQNTASWQGRQKKPLGFLNAISMPFKKISRMRSDPTSCLFVVIIHIMRTGTSPQAIGKERRRIWTEREGEGTERTEFFFFYHLSGTFFPPPPFKHLFTVLTDFNGVCLLTWTVSSLRPGSGTSLYTITYYPQIRVNKYFLNK